MLMQMPGPRDILNLLARPPGIFCCAKALGLGTHFGAKAPGCPGGMVTGQIDTCITIRFETILGVANRVSIESTKRVIFNQKNQKKIL